MALVSFYQNVVTSTYSMAYWDWAKRETETTGLHYMGEFTISSTSRMRSSKMKPIFCGFAGFVTRAFAGFVTRAFAAEFLKAKVKKSTECCDFLEQYCSVRMLNPTELVFVLIRSLFVKY
eukprot:g8406.t1